MERNREKIIFDNHSSKPLYESFEKAFDCYFEHWGDDCPNFAMTWGDFKFNVKTNKNSITIQIFDIDN